MPRSTTTQTVRVPGQDADFVFAFNHNWNRSVCSSFRTCPRTGFACFCNPCYTAKLIDRTGDNFWTGWFNPWSLMSLRTKVRTTFRIRGNLVRDCVASCCLAPCAVMQIENELDYQGIPTLSGKRMF